MSVDWRLPDDLANVADGCQTVTLHRLGRVGDPEDVQALRVSTDAASVQPGSVTRSVKSDWLVAVASDSADPASGDLLDAAGEVWVVETTSRAAAMPHVRCTTRLVADRLDLSGFVDIQLASWHDLGSGPEIASWTTVQTATPAEIVPVEVATDHNASGTSTTATFRVLLAGSPELDQNYRLVDAQGLVYRVNRHTPAISAGAPAIADVSIVSSPEA